jgi:hypothetical protein
MRGIIVESALIAATTTDILQGTRLQTVPANGILTFEISADLNTAAANYTATLQLPDGQTPMTNVLVPASGVIGMLDDRNKLAAGFAIGQGGHPVFSVVETGTAVLIWRAVFTPA